MAETVDEISVNYEEDGVLLCKELDRYVLSKGAWATLMFLYQDLNRQSGEFGPQKVTIRRYQKRDGNYLPRSKFNISSMDQGKKIIEALQTWVDKAE
ncbi:MAG TPA: hypothetical protein DIU35_15355 [Candidatus Latescibacteria bacterium]|nr:hypothetical protein [Gemmatimonadota bacterium]HCR18857.1 hypothetical protein [Candidatus Latescibacterota bacterium]|tara:strand:+ start:6493 stop:6783 length:291 start_codon:yes stop_codon:yes gene_type:complete